MIDLLAVCVKAGQTIDNIYYVHVVYIIYGYRHRVPPACKTRIKWHMPHRDLLPFIDSMGRWSAQ